MSVSPIEAARARHGLAEVAHRSGVALHRESGPVTARCPFPSHGHLDASPSLRLFLEDGIFYCFGCGVRGDVVEWVCRSEGVAWREAIAILDAGSPLANAWASGVSLEHGRHARARSGSEVTDGRSRPDLLRTPPARLREVMAAAWGICSDDGLHESGLTYLMGRGIDAEVLERHTGRREVGHTPLRPNGLARALHSSGFSAEELLDAGLVLVGRDGRSLVDRFRERVLLPVRDEAGHVCGLVGRHVGGGPAPKYLNSPRTAIYDKSVNLYEPLPVSSTARWREVVVVEGTLDAMAVAVAAVRRGRAEEVAPLTQSGRELSAHQLEHALHLGHGALVLALDGDAAGREASKRIAGAAARRGGRARQVGLPDGHDPASLLAEKDVVGLDALVGAASVGRVGRDPRARSMRGAALGRSGKPRFGSGPLGVASDVPTL